ncbi:MAG: hypothetical protein JWO60_749, partial [Frankiales bacterium]|nr:hypothetical protein [Frankiales bacterium]
VDEAVRIIDDAWNAREDSPEPRTAGPEQ